MINTDSLCITDYLQNYTPALLNWTIIIQSLQSALTSALRQPIDCGKVGEPRARWKFAGLKPPAQYIEALRAGK